LYADYSQWEQAAAARKQAKAAKPASAVPERAKPAQTQKRLSYNEAREWETMEQKIMEAETLLAAAQSALDQASQSGDASAAKQSYDDMLAAQEAVDRLYARWAELEAKQAG
jgi:ATP-binding cassette subfamily F protein uup